MTRSYYSVAEHLFAVESSNAALWQCMTNYEPFAAEGNINPIFTLRVKGGRRQAIGEEWTHVVTDNAQADMPRVEVYRSSLEDASLQDASLSAPQKSADFSGTPLQSSGREWLFRVAVVANAPICCEMECNQDFTEGVLYILPDCQDIRFCIDNALMLLYAFRTAPMMTLEMHAAVVVRPSLEDARGTSYSLEDASLQDASLQFRGRSQSELQAKGYLFLGHSGTGKSTHARQWLAAFEDAWLLNDDNPILRVMPNAEVRVYGSPWSGKTACYHNDYVPVGGIVKLSQAPHNKIQTISLPEAYAYMLSSASGLKMDPYMADYIYESIKHVITHVKCYHMECLPNTEAAEVALRGME